MYEYNVTVDNEATYTTFADDAVEAQEKILMDYGITDYYDIYAIRS